MCKCAFSPLNTNNGPPPPVLQDKANPDLPHTQRRHRLYYSEVMRMGDWEAHMDHGRFGRAFNPVYLCAPTPFIQSSA